MSTMPSELGRVVDRRVEQASMVGVMARQARRFFRFVNRVPAADEAERVFWQQRALSEAERMREDAFRRYPPHVC